MCGKQKGGIAVDLPEIKQWVMNRGLLYEIGIHHGDEIILYRIDIDVMYAFFLLPDGEWKSSFVMTDCKDRWLEVIHPLDGGVVHEFLTPLQEGQKSAKMNCRFKNNERYEWYHVNLQRIDEEIQENQTWAIGYRKQLALSSRIDAFAYADQLDGNFCIYTEEAWRAALRRQLTRYRKEHGVLCIMNFNQFHKINERVGYHGADQLVLELIDLLREQLTQAALIGRLGPDVLGIYMSDIIGEEDWVSKMQRVINKMEQKYQKRGHAVSLCAGVAEYPTHAQREDVLVEKAREAWVNNKLAQSSRVLVYQSGMLQYIWEKYLGKSWENSNAYDALTGLYQVQEFKRHMVDVLQKRKNKQYVIVYSDISNFKYVNATFGYERGDEILKNWAKILQEEEPNVLFACRDGEDHFISLREMGEDLSEDALSRELNLSKQMIEYRMKKRFKGSNFTLNTGAYHVRTDETDCNAAIACANMARKTARNSSTKCAFYTDTMREAANEETAMVSSLDEAIHKKEFCIYLQPKVACKSEKVVGAEALVRWMRNGQQLVFPDKFIRIFERYGCIEKLDYYVYEQAFSLVRRWLDEGKPVIPISLNVSRIHFKNTDLIDRLEYLLRCYKVPVDAIEFEITESMYTENLPALNQIMAYFKERGFRVSMDDFGADGSCLNALSTIPVDVVKMDKVFMKRGSLEKADKILIKNVIRMVNELQKVVLCEGVETDVQKKFISSVGCDVWQGYLCSKPLPVDEFENLIKNRPVQAVVC